jgi:hypothetical protein
VSFKRTKWTCLASGVLLAVLGLFAVSYAWRVACSQFAYYGLKYGRYATATLETKQELATRAYAQYPWNYYLCQLMAKEAWENVNIRNVDADGERLSLANEWCSRGRELNPYDRSLAWTAVSIAGVDSAQKAVAVWERYVERVFWDPWNLASLIKLKAMAGQVKDARTLLALLDGRPEYRDAAMAVDQAIGTGQAMITQ